MADRRERPLLVAVGSSSKKAGKSTLATYLVRELGAENALKVSAGTHGPTGIITEPGVTGREGTDTGYLREAGASTVVWVNVPVEDAPDKIREALELFPGGGVLVAEGNSAVTYPDTVFSIFLATVPLTEFKPSAVEALPRADLVLVDLRGALSGRDVTVIRSELEERAPGARLIFFRDDRGMAEARLEAAVAARRALWVARQPT